MPRLRCRFVFGHEEAERVVAIVEKATGEPCPCQQGKPCPLLPDLPGKTLAVGDTYAQGARPPSVLLQLTDKNGNKLAARPLVPMMAATYAMPLFGLEQIRPIATLMGHLFGVN